MATKVASKKATKLAAEKRAENPDPQPPHRGRIYTRLEFARLVGVSAWTLRAWHHEGYFRARFGGKQGRGKAMLYTEDQVAELRKLPPRHEPASFKHGMLYTAADAQQCFAALEEGKSPRHCVTVLGVHPEAVAAIVERYALLDQGFSVARDLLDRINALENLDGLPIQSPEDLVRVMTKASAEIEALEDRQQRACHACGQRASAYCVDCVAKTVAEAKKEASADDAEAPGNDAA